MKFTSHKNFPAIYVSGLFLVFILPLLWLGGSRLMNVYKLATNGERLEGTLVRVNCGGRRQAAKRYLEYCVSYDQNKDGKKETKVFGSPMFFLFAEYKLGERVTVIQERGNPKNAEIDRGNLNWFMISLNGIFFILTGTALLLFLVFLLRTGKLTR